MAERILRIEGDRALQRTLRRLRREEPRIAADTLNRVAFELREAEAKEVERVFEFAGASTQRFLASPRSFVFDKATASNPQVRFMPSRKAGPILADHEGGDTISASQGAKRLVLGDRLAVPIFAKRGARGKVIKGQSLGKVLAPGGRGFVRGDKVWQRATKRFAKKSGRSLRLLYVLIPRAFLKPRFKFFEVAEKTAARELPRKYERALEKAARQAAAQGGRARR